MPRMGKKLKEIGINQILNMLKNLQVQLGLDFWKGTSQSPVKITKQGQQWGSGKFNEAPATVTPDGDATFQSVIQMMEWATDVWEESFANDNQTNTTLTSLGASEASGQTVITVVSTTGLAAGMYVDISDGSNFERRKILTVDDGTTLTLTEGLENSYAAGTPLGRYTGLITSTITDIWTGPGWEYISSVSDTADSIAVPTNAIWAYVEITASRGGTFSVQGSVLLHKTGNTGGTFSSLHDYAGSYKIQQGSASWSGNTITLSYGGHSTAVSGQAHFFADGSFDVGTSNYWGFDEDVVLGDGSDGSFTSSGDATWSSEKNYTDVTIQSGHTITIEKDVVIRCTGAFNIESGGAVTSKGEGDTGGSPSGYPNAGNGDGGGGGGSYCDPFGKSRGGGGGGFGVGGDAGQCPVSCNGCGPSVGGSTYGVAAIDGTLYGSGGGSGNKSGGGSGSVGTGGDGGGNIVIHCLSFTCAGTMDSDGNDGGDANYTGGNASFSGGGAGSGGSIYVRAVNSATLGSGLVTAAGGTGGAEDHGPADNTSGNGGNAGAGRIRIESNSISGTTTPTYYNSGETISGGLNEATYYSIVDAHQIGKRFAIVEIKHNRTVRYNLDAAPAQEDLTIQIDGDKTGEFAVGDTISIYDVNNYKNERHTITAIDYNVTVASKTTITLNSPLARAYLTSGFVERVDFIPSMWIGDDTADEELNDLTWRGTQVNGTVNTDYYTYKINLTRTFVIIMIKASRNDGSLAPRIYNLKVTTYP